MASNIRQRYSRSVEIPPFLFDIFLSNKARQVLYLTPSVRAANVIGSTSPNLMGQVKGSKDLES